MTWPWIVQMYIPDDDFKGDDNNNSDDSDDDSDNVKSGQSSHCRGTSWEALVLVWPRCRPSRAGQTGFPINSSLPRFYSFLHHNAKLAHAISDIFYVIQELLWALQGQVLSLPTFLLNVICQNIGSFKLVISGQDEYIRDWWSVVIDTGLFVLQLKARYLNLIYLMECWKWIQ